MLNIEDEGSQLIFNAMNGWTKLLRVSSGSNLYVCGAREETRNHMYTELHPKPEV